MSASSAESFMGLVSPDPLGMLRVWWFWSVGQRIERRMNLLVFLFKLNSQDA